MTLPAFAAKRGRLQQISIDICCRRPRSATSQPRAAATVDRRDRRTYYAGRVNKLKLKCTMPHEECRQGTHFPNSEHMTSATPDLRLPSSRKASLPLDRHQITLLGGRHTCANNLPKIVT